MGRLKEQLLQESDGNIGEPQSFKEPIKVVFRDKYGQLDTKYCEIITFSHLLGHVLDGNTYLCGIKDLISIQ